MAAAALSLVAMPVKLAAFPAASSITAPFRLSAVTSRSLDASPSCTVYVKTNWLLAALTKLALRIGVVLRTRCGSPWAVSTVTDSVNSRMMVIFCPGPYVPSSVELVTLLIVAPAVSMVIAVASAATRFLLPSASSNLSAATEICPGVVESAFGVKIAEYVDPLPEKPESVPPVAVMSASSKSTESAESTNVMTAVSLLPSVVALDVIATVGATVFTASVTAPSVLSLPALSENAAAGTVMVAAPTKSGSGVKTAV